MDKISQLAKFLSSGKPERMKKLYRGESLPYKSKGLPDWMKEDDSWARAYDSTTGRWFTDDPEVAAWYARYNNAGPTDVAVGEQIPFPFGYIKSLLIPESLAETGRVSLDPVAKRYSLDPTKEFLVPPEWAKKAR